MNLARLMSPELWGSIRYQPHHPCGDAVWSMPNCQPGHFTKPCGHWQGSMSFCRVPSAWLSCFKPLSMCQCACMEEPSLGRARRGSKETWRIWGEGLRQTLGRQRESDHVPPPSGAGWKQEALSLGSSCNSILHEVFPLARYHG